eukprot:9363385-Heterocapsa_arctica.AAC.1
MSPRTRVNCHMMWDQSSISDSPAALEYVNDAIEQKRAEQSTLRGNPATGDIMIMATMIGGLPISSACLEM